MNYKKYLGDAVYVDWNGFAVVLTTENGLSETNRIVLEPEVYEALMEYLPALRSQLSIERARGPS